MIRPPFALARRFVAGETLPEAIEAVRGLNGRGLSASLDILGENVSDPAAAAAAREDYVRLLDEIARSGVDANISIKLTMLGLDRGEGPCEENLRAVLAAARERGTFVRIDMEGSRYTAATLALFHRTFPEFPDSGVVIQSYLYRSRADVAELNRSGARVRLVKGAYKEPPSIAWPRREDVNRSFDELAEALIGGGRYPAIATHDDARIEHARAAAERLGVPRTAYELQMLYGIRRARQETLAREGHPVRIYVPYGRDWFPYFYRRLRERKENVFFVLRNLFRS
ncbi:MAG TPA: proline dehydrogenase family protein [Gemmatimonadota bacterium]